MRRALVERYPYAHCELDFETPLQLLVATVLSAQTTDVMVNAVTPTLFSRWPTAEALAGADRDENGLHIPAGKTNNKLSIVHDNTRSLAERLRGAEGRMDEMNATITTFSDSIRTAVEHRVREMAESLPLPSSVANAMTYEREDQRCCLAWSAYMRAHQSLLGRTQDLDTFAQASWKVRVHKCKLVMTS